MPVHAVHVIVAVGSNSSDLVTNAWAFHLLYAACEARQRMLLSRGLKLSRQCRGVVCSALRGRPNHHRRPVAMGKRKADVDSGDEVYLEPEDLDVEVCC
jgi:hypothetical protein